MHYKPYQHQCFQYPIQSSQNDVRTHSRLGKTSRGAQSHTKPSPAPVSSSGASSWGQPGLRWVWRGLRVRSREHGWMGGGSQCGRWVCVCGMGRGGGGKGAGCVGRQGSSAGAPCRLTRGRGCVGRYAQCNNVAEKGGRVAPARDVQGRPEHSYIIWGTGEEVANVGRELETKKKKKICCTRFQI